MKRFKNLRNNLAKIVICNIIFGFIVVVVLSHVALALYIATCDDPIPLLEYLDTEPDNSMIRSGY